MWIVRHGRTQCSFQVCSVAPLIVSACVCSWRSPAAHSRIDGAPPLSDFPPDRGLVL
jgi:hypothetical protein